NSSKTLTVDELFYLKEQFFGEPSKNESINMENIKAKCPFDAIEIINLLKDFEKDTTHHYAVNTFKLHSYAFAINFQEKVFDVWRGHGPSAKDELKEAQRVLHQLKVKVFSESDNNKALLSTQERRRRSNSSLNVSVE
ncbi:kinesin light chain-related protein 1, partial [Tanacetum coccineum]